MTFLNTHRAHSVAFFPFNPLFQSIAMLFLKSLQFWLT